jgi:hypothetical protein
MLVRARKRGGTLGSTAEIVDQRHGRSIGRAPAA